MKIWAVNLKKFTYWADKPGAYWVGEGQKSELLNLA